MAESNNTQHAARARLADARGSAAAPLEHKKEYGVSIKQQIENTFGDKSLDHALFYNHEGSLRFELSLGPSYVEMFLQAYEKAKKIIDFTFSKSNSLCVCLAFVCEGRFISSLSTFRSLRDCQIEIPSHYEAWQKSYPDDEYTRTFIAFQVDNSELPKFLWGTFANELGIRPRSKCKLYIYDTDLGVMAHPYDDRGMDLIGPNKSLLKSVYDDFGSYLLDYDRAEMDRFFKKL